MLESLKVIRDVGLSNYSCRRIVGQQESLEAQTIICRDAIRYLVSRERLEMPTVSIRFISHESFHSRPHGFKFLVTQFAGHEYGVVDGD